MTERQEDQRIAEHLAAENLWRADSRCCVKHLVTCFCPECKAERANPQDYMRATPPFTLSPHPPLLMRPVPFWWTVASAAGVAVVVAFVSFALGVSP